MGTIASNDRNLTFIRLDRLTSAGGMVTAYHDRWWSTCPERGVLIWKRNSPQCNSSEAIARRLGEMYPWAEVRQFPLVLVPHDCRDY